MEIIIDIHDHEGNSEDRAVYVFDQEATFGDLRKKIYDVFKVESHNQNLSFNGNQLLVGNLREAKITHGDTIILKHADIKWWPRYKDYVETTIKSKADRIENAKQAVKLHEKLMESGFFGLYPKFDDFRKEMQPKVAAWLDGTTQFMGETAKLYFYTKHVQNGGVDDSDFIYHYKPKPISQGGIHPGIIVKVQLHGENKVTKYSIKCHHYEASSYSPRSSVPDIKEIFIYKLLELINVGPNVQFIFPSKLIGSKTTVYIATKWRDDFIHLFDLRGDTKNKIPATANIVALVQLDLLSMLLYINDLHEKNCGQWRDTNTAAVVDFMPKECRTYKKLEEELLSKNRVIAWDSTIYEIFDQCEKDERLAIVKEWLKKSDLLRKIDMADEQIVKEKNQMKASGIDFKGSKGVTDELKRYIETVKQTVTELVNLLKIYA